MKRKLFHLTFSFAIQITWDWHFLAWICLWISVWMCVTKYNIGNPTVSLLLILAICQKHCLFFSLWNMRIYDYGLFESRQKKVKDVIQHILFLFLQTKLIHNDSFKFCILILFTFIRFQVLYLLTFIRNLSNSISFRKF